MYQNLISVPTLTTPKLPLLLPMHIFQTFAILTVSISLLPFLFSTY